jgi:hypothetical protein
MEQWDFEVLIQKKKGKKNAEAKSYEKYKID